MGTNGNRRSKIELEECINIGIKVLEEYNYIIGLQQFRIEYQNALMENNITTPTDSRTITSDIKKIENKIKKEHREIFWQSAPVEKPPPHSQFLELGKEISEYIHRVYLCSNNQEYLLYKADNDFQNKSITLSAFKKKVKKLSLLKSKKRKESAPDDDSEQNIKTESDRMHYPTFNNDTLVRVYIIFYKYGDEDNDNFINQKVKKTAKFYDDHELKKVLFTNEMNYCTEIVSRLGFLTSIMTDLYYTIYP